MFSYSSDESSSPNDWSNTGWIRIDWFCLNDRAYSNREMLKRKIYLPRMIEWVNKGNVRCFVQTNSSIKWWRTHHYYHSSIAQTHTSVDSSTRIQNQWFVPMLRAYLVECFHSMDHRMGSNRRIENLWRLLVHRRIGPRFYRASSRMCRVLSQSRDGCRN